MSAPGEEPGAGVPGLVAASSNAVGAGAAAAAAAAAMPPPPPPPPPPADAAEAKAGEIGNGGIAQGGPAAERGPGG